MKTLGNAKQVSEFLGIVLIKDMVSKEKKVVLQTRITELELEVKRLKERV